MSSHTCLIIFRVIIYQAVLLYDESKSCNDGSVNFVWEGKRILIPEEPNSNGTIFTYMMKVFVYRK